jgi:hypothetical protein
LLPIHSNLNCAGCHESSRPVVIAAIAAGDKRCATCHPTADHAALHVTADPAVACQASSCHPGTNLLPTHSTGACAGCHQSSNPAVIAAIAAGDKRCATCHPGGGPHAASHNGGVSRPDCLDCHKSNIAEEHANNCDKCHKSTDPRVVAAIANHKVTCGECHTPALHATGFWSPKTDYYAWTSTPGPRNSGTPLGELGDNPANPSPHAGYLATTAKCGICHSVHRAVGTGTKLLPTADASCAGCHAGGTTITAKQITVGVPNMNWRKGDTAATEWAYGGAGPHNDGLKTLYDDGEWDGISTPPAPSFSTNPFERYGCATRRCHATNPHGANSSQYKVFAQKLLFNNTVEQDDEEWLAENPTDQRTGTYGGLDAVYDHLGATDASVARFIDNNGAYVRVNPTNNTEIQVKKTGDADWRTPVAAEERALVAGLTCGRPSNPGTGEDECHAEASYAVIDKGIKENRNHGTKISGNDGSLPAYPDATQDPVNGSNNFFRTDNTGGEAAGFGGNDNRDSKTGHVAGAFLAVPGAGSYAPIAGCTSCHNQTDSANTVAGNYTFPHGQTPVGTTNALAENGTTGTMVRSRIWSGIGGSLGATQTVTSSTSKAFDGQCLKCHRGAADLVSGEPTQGIGITR